MVTRRAAGILRPVDRLILAAATSSTPPDASSVPSSVRTTLADPHWRRAIEEEYAALLANHTWDLVPRPPGTNVVTGKWLFRHKLTSDGSLDLSRDWAIHQLDVKNAFLHGTLTETVYCSQPTGFVDADRLDLVCRLTRSLYGLKQAPRA
jgi:hypothetical protein